MKRIFEIPWVLFEKSANLYFDWPKYWIWRTLEQVTNYFSKWHFHNAWKEVFWPKFFLNFMHDGTFENVHEIQKFFLPKDFFWGIMKVPFTKNIHNFFQGLPNPGFRSVKVQTETVLKKDLKDFKNSFYLGFLWIPGKTGKQN